MASSKCEEKEPQTPLLQKISDLERRASKLEEQFDELLTKTDELEQHAAKFVIMTEKDRHITDLISLLMKCDKRSNDLVDYMCLFFAAVVKKMNEKGTNLSSMRDLWYSLTKENVMSVFVETIVSLEFFEKDAEDLRLVLDLLYDKSDGEYMEAVGNSTRKPTGCHGYKPDDPNTTEVLVNYMLLQEDVDSGLIGIMRRAVQVAGFVLASNYKMDDDGQEPTICDPEQQAVNVSSQQTEATVVSV